MVKSITTAFLILFLISCKEENLPPVAKCNSFPKFGDTTVLFEFDAGKSVAGNGLRVALSYRWDFDSDSVWDTDVRTESSVGHYFINPGIYQVKVEVSDINGFTDTTSTSIQTVGRNKDVEIMTDPRDGRTYRIVKVKGSWWMAENLKFGIKIDKKIEQTDNGIVEMYRWSSRKDADTIGGTYRWQEAMNYNLNSTQGICPEGWHIPTIIEWENLITGVPMWYAVRYYGTNGLSELNLQTYNLVYRNLGDIQTFNFLTGGFWSSDYK
jgi:uncharacterized protein (TIGR02145 family)